jgi:hypothetical protein
MSTRTTVTPRRRPLRAIADWICVLVAGSCLWGLAFTAIDVVLRIVSGGTSWQELLHELIGQVVIFTVLIVAAWRSTSWYAAQVARRAYARA